MSDTGYTIIGTLNFKCIEKKAKTNVYCAEDALGRAPVGIIKWYGPWRQYCLFIGAASEVVFNSGCLSDVAHFMDERDKTEYKYITFEVIDPGHHWVVLNKRSRTGLGSVEFFEAAGGYRFFFFGSDVMYSLVRLKEIADFLRFLNEKHKTAKEVGK